MKKNPTPVLKWNILILLLLHPALRISANPAAGASDTWKPRSQGMYGGFIPAFAISPDFAVDHSLFIGTSEAGVYKSTNGGDTWTAANNGFPEGHPLTQVAFSPDYIRDGSLYTFFSEVYVSTDRGDSWSPLGSLPGIAT